MSALKDIYSPDFYNTFAETLLKTIPDFDKQRFLALIFDAEFVQKELKDRMRHTTRVLHHFLPMEFREAVVQMKKIITQIRQNKEKEDSLAYIFFPDYIETYGLEDYENSVKAIEFVTQFVSCEFAVRPFLLKYGAKMMNQMQQWALHESHKVRRLASEGSRPRLPWAMAIPALKKDPTPCILLLEILKNDPSEWVRRSVANHLNDISKDHPDLVLKVANAWKGKTKETDAMIKHACRTLLKQGHRDVLALYNLVSEQVHVENFSILTPEIAIGDNLEFTVSIVNENGNRHTVRLEYAVYYQKQNGQLSKKVFKISEREYASAERATIRRKQKFVPITTRKFYPGTHQLSIIINGEEKEMGVFELMA